MRFIGFSKRSSGEEVHTFVIGRSEMKLLYDLCKENMERFPKITDTQVIRTRLKEMRAALFNALKETPKSN